MYLVWDQELIIMSNKWNWKIKALRKTSLMYPHDLVLDRWQWSVTTVVMISYSTLEPDHQGTKNRSQGNSTLNYWFKLCTVTIKHTRFKCRHVFQHIYLFAWFFFWQLLLCVHRHEKELQNTQKINVSTEFKTLSQAATCFCFCQATPSKSTDLGSRTQSRMTVLLTLSREVQNCFLIRTLYSAVTLNQAAGQLFLFIMVYRVKES